MYISTNEVNLSTNNQLFLDKTIQPIMINTTKTILMNDLENIGTYLLFRNNFHSNPISEVLERSLTIRTE